MEVTAHESGHVLLRERLGQQLEELSSYKQKGELDFLPPDADEAFAFWFSYVMTNLEFPLERVRKNYESQGMYFDRLINKYNKLKNSTARMGIAATLDPNNLATMLF